ncbi:hypothetical protein AB0C42_24070 [Micromonospora taraxaci]|uniref:hypothetical protein n=1 Tax=Micromonospora taraxaci TaxID=1316803 RepID=UPI0034017156
MYPPPHPPPPPPRQKTSVGVWILVAWFVGPAVLVALCCSGALLAGMVGAAVEGPPKPLPSQVTEQAEPSN